MLSPRSVSGIDETSRYVRTRVNNTEENVLNLRNGFSSLLRAQERVRAKGHKLSNAFKVFGERETSAVKSCLVATSEGINEIEKIRKELQDRIDLKCREPLGMYASICDGVLDDLKVREVAIRKEQEKQVALDRAQVRDSGNRTRINQGQIELSGASHEATTSSLALTETVERFELKKVSDIKSVLLEFCYAQILFHAKSLEIVSDLMTHVLSNDFDADVDEVCDKIRPHPPKETSMRRGTLSAQRG